MNSPESRSSLNNTDPNAIADNVIRHEGDSRSVISSDKEASSDSGGMLIIGTSDKEEGRRQQEQEGGGGNSPLLPLMIKNHPYFPLVEYFLIKCEKATRLMNNESDVVEKEVEFIVRLQHELHRGRMKTDNAELDDLMLNYVQNLNYQLHELRKVDELCDDFLRRYSARLRARFAQESLFCVSAEFENELPSAISACLQDMSRPVVATIQTSSGPVSVPLTCNTNDVPAAGRGCTSGIGARTVPVPVPVPAVPDVHVPNLHIDTLPSKDITSHVLRDNKKKRSPAPLNTVAQISETFCDAASTFKTKRNSLPRRSVEVLRKWLFQNMTHPYPSDDEKHRLSVKTGLNLTQVNNWFINARRRILQPLLDGNSSVLPPDADSTNNLFAAAMSSSSGRHQKFTSSSSFASSTMNNYQPIGSDLDEDESRDSLDFYDGGGGGTAKATETDQSDTNSRPLHTSESDQSASTANLKIGGAGGGSSSYHSIDQLIGNRCSTNRKTAPDSKDAASLTSPPIDQPLSASTNQKHSAHTPPTNQKQSASISSQMQLTSTNQMRTASSPSSSTNQNQSSTSTNDDDQSQSDDPDHSNTAGPTLRRKRPRKRRRLKAGSSASGQNLNSLIDGVA